MLNLSVHFISFFMCIYMMLRLFIQEMIQIGIKEVSQDVMDMRRLGALPSWNQGWIGRVAQELWRSESSSRTGLRCVKTLYSAGEPDEPFQTLDASTAIVHQLVFSHGSTTTGTPNKSQCNASQPGKLFRIHNSSQTLVGINLNMFCCHLWWIHKKQMLLLFKD